MLSVQVIESGEVDTELDFWRRVTQGATGEGQEIKGYQVN